MSAVISEEIETTLKALKRRGFDARFAENREVARKIVVDMVPEHWIVGCGDSTTIRSIGLPEALQDLGNMVTNPFIRPKIMRRGKIGKWPYQLMRHVSQHCDVFLSSSNAVTMDGKLVNTDGAGFRVAAQFFGPLLSILIVGRNKIVKNAEDGRERIRLIAPLHARTIGFDCPCRRLGKCIEPKGVCPPDKSICNVTVVMERRPCVTGIVVAVVVVDDDLGLGWDPSWPQERIDKIVAEYMEFTPPHTPREDLIQHT